MNENEKRIHDEQFERIKDSANRVISTLKSNPELRADIMHRISLHMILDAIELKNHGIYVSDEEES